MAKVYFEHLDEPVECSAGDTIYDVAMSANSPLSSACGAKASCGLCRVKVLEGAEFLSPLNAAEESHLGNVYHINKVRLGCQAQIANNDAIVKIKHVGRPKKKKK